jgi:hypothetical protein
MSTIPQEMESSILWPKESLAPVSEFDISVVAGKYSNLC